jgi:hypothetical protein
MSVKSPGLFEVMVAQVYQRMHETGVHDIHDVCRRLAMSTTDTPTERLAMWAILRDYIHEANATRA